MSLCFSHTRLCALVAGPERPRRTSTDWHVPPLIYSNHAVPPYHYTTFVDVVLSCDIDIHTIRTPASTQTQRMGDDALWHFIFRRRAVVVVFVVANQAGIAIRCVWTEIL